MRGTDSRHALADRRRERPVVNLQYSDRYSEASPWRHLKTRTAVLDRLELRRLHADLITCYKIINNMVAVPFNSFFKFAVSTNTRSHPLKLMLPES